MFLARMPPLPDQDSVPRECGTRRAGEKKNMQRARGWATSRRAPRASTAETHHPGVPPPAALGSMTATPSWPRVREAPALAVCVLALLTLPHRGPLGR
jgi:hypothetical protein